MGFIRRVSITLIVIALVIAALNLYMNVMINYSLPSMQLDLSVDGDLFGFHEMEHEADGHFGKGTRPEKFDPQPHPPAGIINDLDLDERMGGHHPRSFAAIRGMSKMDVARMSGVLRDPQGIFQREGAAPVISCMGLCPPSNSALNQTGYVDAAIMKQMRSDRLKQLVASQRSSITDSGSIVRTSASFGLADFTAVWDLLSGWAESKGRALYPPAYHDWARVVTTISQAPIRGATNPKRGVQVKALLELQGSQEAFFKPMRYKRDFVVQGAPFDGADRHNGEIAGFHLARLLGFNRVPVAVGRSVDLKKDIFRVADSTLLDAFFEDSVGGRLCLLRKAKCRDFCNNRNYSACGERGTNRLEGVVIVKLPESVEIRSARSPWARTYKPGLLAPWERDTNYCATSVSGVKSYGKPPIFLDFIDTAIFDFLISNADRHHVELTWDEGNNHAGTMILLMDNGKSFGDPSKDELSILAPLYQCCQLRRKTYDVLRYYVTNDVNLASSLDRELEIDPLYPILTLPHLNAINRRLVKVWALAQVCIRERGQINVIKDDGFR